MPEPAMTEIRWCLLCQEFAEIGVMDEKSICFWPEPFARSRAGNTCTEEYSPTLGLGDCELAVVLKALGLTQEAPR